MGALASGGVRLTAAVHRAGVCGCDAPRVKRECEADKPVRVTRVCIANISATWRQSLQKISWRQPLWLVFCLHLQPLSSQCQAA